MNDLSVSFLIDSPRRVYSSMVVWSNLFCRTSPAEFIVPYDQYMESLKNNYTIGMRFKMRFEGEEAPEQRYECVVISQKKFSRLC